MLRRFPLLTTIFAASLGVACATAVIRPDARDAQWASAKWPGTTVGDLDRGRETFVGRCGGCHNLPEPNVKTPEEWSRVLDEMAARSKLTPDEKDLVLRYLSAASQRLGKAGG